MTATPSINAPTLEGRLLALKQLVDEGANVPSGQASPAYIQRVDAALAAINAAAAIDQRVAAATCSGGVFGLGATCKDASGARVTKSQIDTAKELAPADAMIRATLTAVVERQTERNGRSLGATPTTWSRQLDANVSRANAALTKLRAGDESAAADLSAAISAVGTTLRGVRAEAAADQNRGNALLRDINGFAPIADNTSLFNGRRTEKAALATARGQVQFIGAEVAAETAMANSARDVVRPLVAGRLQNDPALASRGYPRMTEQSEAWARLGAAATATSNAASAFAGAADELVRSHATITDGPQTIANLDGALAQARSNYEDAVRSLQGARTNHAQTAASLAAQRSTADALLTVAVAAARRADNQRVDAENVANQRASEARALAQDIADLQERLNQALAAGATSSSSGTGSGTGLGNSSGTGLGGGSGTGLGGSSGTGLGSSTRSGSGLGSATAGSSGTGLPSNGADVSGMRSRLSSMRERKADALIVLQRAEYARDRAIDSYNVAAAASASALGVAQNIQVQQRDNDNRLAQAEGYTTGRKGEFDDATSRRQAAVNAINTANRYVAAAETTMANKARAYNATLAPLSATVRAAKVGDAGQAALAAIPAEPIDASAVGQAVRQNAQGAAALVQAGSALTQPADRRVALAGSSKQRLDQQAAALVDGAVTEALQ